MLHGDHSAVMAAKTPTPALVVATRAAERRDGPVRSPTHSFDKVAAGETYHGLRAQKTDRAEAAHNAPRRQTKRAAGGEAALPVVR